MEGNCRGIFWGSIPDLLRRTEQIHKPQYRHFPGRDLNQYHRKTKMIFEPKHVVIITYQLLCIIWHRLYLRKWLWWKDYRIAFIYPYIRNTAKWNKWKSEGPPGCKFHLYKYTMMYQSNTTKLYYVYYCIRATCFDSYRIIFRPF